MPGIVTVNDRVSGGESAASIAQVLSKAWLACAEHHGHGVNSQSVTNWRLSSSILDFGTVRADDSLSQLCIQWQASTNWRSLRD